MDNRDKLIDMLKERHAYYKETFDTVSGQKVLKDLEEGCYVNRSTVTDTVNVDAYQIAFREGMRSVYLKIINCISDEQLKKVDIQNAKEDGTGA